jgi:hypothetical protein
MTTVSAIPADTHRERMLQFLREGRGYQFLNIAEPYLAQCPDDHYIRLMAVREYLALNLIEPARSLLDVEPAVVELPAELAELRESLQSLPGAAIPWSSFTAQFEANLTALSDRGVDVAPIRQAWSGEQPRFELFRDRNKVYQVRRYDGNSSWRWFPFLGDHRVVDFVRAMPEGIGANMPGPYLFEGLGMGWFFERVYHATRNTFLGYSCALFVVEPQPASLAVVLHLRDWREILADARVHLFVGLSCANQLVRAWEEDYDLPFPHQAFTCGTVPAEDSPRAVELVQRAAGTREHAVRESLHDLERRYAARTLPFWAKRFDEALSRRGEPLRILAAVSTHTTFLQHSMRDARRALEALGHRCLVLTEKTPFAVTGPLTYHNAIREFDPDLFFILDHLRPEFETILPRNLPILTWDQDQLPHVFTKANLERIAKHDFVAGCSKSRCLTLGCDPRQFLHARVPTCPEQFGGDPLTDDELSRYTCDVSYVSHASQTPRAFHEQERQGYAHPTLAKLLDEMYQQMPAMLGRYRTADIGVMTAVLAEGCRRCGITNLDPDLEARLQGWYLWRLGDRLFRHEALEWVARWAQRTGRSFRIYGNGWDKHPTLSEFAAGPADNGRELLCVYRASRINLQLMPAGFIHQRSLDGMAAGGFFLTRLCPHDLRGTTLRRLEARVQELRIASTNELLGCSDAELQTLLRGYLGDSIRTVDHHKYDLLGQVRMNAELLYPDEVFPDFREIVFDSAEEFAAAAERFLADEPCRRAIADRMHNVVVERFSYRSTMDHFLRSMAAYLAEISARASF